ncbi:MAG: tyrosine-type recombinase/integrase, partial [Candidatus Acidiferrales bacterium]
MLSIYRRHRRSCAHRSEGRKHQDCRCPIWVSGSIGGQEIRKVLGELNWRRANKAVLEWEETASEPQTLAGRISIAEAMDEFLADARARKLKDSTIDRHRIVFRQLEAFAASQGMRHLRELDTPTLTKFRASWKGRSGLADMKKLERLRSFFKFTQANGYTEQNPAAAIRSPKIRPNPTLPFSQEEMLAILAAAAKKIAGVRAQGKNRARRVRALVLFLRYTGLRISDAIGCAADRLQDGKLFLYTAKTGQHVYCPLPEFVVNELEAVPKVSERYWFWTGAGKVETSRKKWGKALSDLFEDAKVKEGHAHRFRDTFAVELLQAGTPIERVSIFLGHASVRITEKHYNPWNRARQEQAEADVKRSWASDPVVLLETKGTPEVHGKREA